MNRFGWSLRAAAFLALGVASALQALVLIPSVTESAPGASWPTSFLGFEFLASVAGVGFGLALFCGLAALLVEDVDS